MNDHELDEMLDRWEAPPLRDSLREELRTRFAGIPKHAVRARRLRRIMGTISRIPIGRIALPGIAAAVLVFGIVQVSPKTVRMASPAYRIPFYVEFGFSRYADDGSFAHMSLITAFPYAGHEIVMSVTEPGRSVLNKVRRFAMSVRNQVILLDPSWVLPKEPPMAEPAWFAGFVSSGCASGRNVVGNEIIAATPPLSSRRHSLLTESRTGWLRTWTASP